MMNSNDCRIIDTPWTQYTEADIARLREVFDVVADADDWKNPIDATFDPEWTCPEIVRAAILFFAGCDCEFTPTLVYRSLLDVRAVGYYAAVGA